MSFDYQHAFITGGASGIGLGIADALAACGVSVTIADIDQRALDRALSERSSGFFGVFLDVQDRRSWTEAKDKAEAAFGPVDILVNNAGVTVDGLDLAELPAADFERVVGIDLIGVFNGVSTFGADLKHRGAGHIVNTASVMGLLSGVKGMGAYCAVKAAVVALSEALRKEMAPYNVGVSVLCPGFVTSNLRETSSRVLSAVKQRELGQSREGMAPLTAGQCVVNGIRQNLAYIFTHPEYVTHLEQRTAAICQDAPLARQGL